MAKATFVKVAQKTIYEKGKSVQYVSKTGKREVQTLSKIDRTIPKDENDKVFIEKGESYFWWSFLKGGKHFSKNQPKRSQLTQSNYLSQLYDLQDEMQAVNPKSSEALADVIEDLKGNLENLKEIVMGLILQKIIKKLFHGLK